MEAIKVIAHVGEPLVGKLLLLDAKNMHWQQFTLPKDSNCPSCGNG
jgi:adenylyltransferase/sulfurtransferase